MRQKTKPENLAARWLLSGFIVASLTFVIACDGEKAQTPGSAGSPALTHEQKIANAYREDNNGWIYLHLEGAPEVIGYQHGYLAAAEIVDVRDALAMSLEHDTKKNWEFYRTESLKLFWAKTPEEYQKELDGIVSGVNAKLGANTIDRADAVALNAMEEMAFYYVPWLESKKNPKAAENKAPGNCSAFAATGSWTRDGKIVMAHNAWTSYVIGERWNLIVDLVPEKGHRIFMDAMPGFIHSGDDFYVSAGGIIVTETTITQFQGFDPNGIAEFVRARKAIQYADSIDDWAATMREGNNGGYANDWLIGDNKTGEIARLELGLKNVLLERTKDGYFVGSNFPVNPKLIKEETTFDTESQEHLAQCPACPLGRVDEGEQGKDRYRSPPNCSKPTTSIRFARPTRAAPILSVAMWKDDPRGIPEWEWGGFYPGGTVQAKAVDGTLAAGLKFWASMGHPCGQTFVAKDFLKAHPEYAWQEKFLKDMPGRPWTLFEKGSRTP